MGRAFLSSLALYFVALTVWAQTDNRTVLGQANEFLAAGATAIRAGRYDDGIRLTALGLDRYSSTPSERAAALANLCGAFAAKGDLDVAIEHCSESILLNDRNWRAYSNRSYAYFLKGMYAEAVLDVDAAAVLAPDARQVQQIRGMINERRLLPRVTMEDHPSQR